MNIIESYVQAINYHDLEKAEKLFSQNARIEIDGKAGIEGKAEIRKYLEGMDPDGTFTVEEMKIADTEATARYTYIDGKTKKGEWKFTLEKGQIQKLEISESAR